MSDPEDFPPLTLKADDTVGLYFLCDEAGAEDLRDFLTADEVKFSFNPTDGTHLAEAGKALFAFGNANPRFIVEALEFVGEEVLIDRAVVMPEDAYLPPVNQLLALGEPGRVEKRDYVVLGIASDDIPALIRMATDEQLHSGPPESPVVYAPVHAWRALAQLRAQAAIAPLARLTEFLADPAHGDWSRVAAAKTVGVIGETHPESRLDGIARLSAQLDRFAEQSETLNAFVISALWDLKAVEALPVIERAFASGRVDESIVGDFEDVQIEFGLKTRREHPRKPNKLTIMGEQLRAQWKAAGIPLPEEADGDFPELEDDIVDPELELPAISLPYIAPPKVGRNDPCPCGSGKKYKKCCGG